jgi:peptidylprolyl isomerase
MKNLFQTAAFVALVLLLALGCAGEKRAKDGDNVRIHYTGKFDDGTTFDSTEGREPLELVIGSGTLFPVFEMAIIEMAVGESKTITIPAEDAFGPRYEELVGKIPVGQFGEGGAPEVGQRFQMTRPDSSPFWVSVLEISEDSVTLDANHPLAGKDLTFDIELVEIL